MNTLISHLTKPPLSLPPSESLQELKWLLDKILTQRLYRFGIAIPRYARKSITNETETRWLLNELHSGSDRIVKVFDGLGEREKAVLRKWVVERRVGGMEPLQYILGNQPFLSLPLHVQKPTLIPRWETEDWVSELLQDLTPHRHLRLLELCSGSGCISLSLSKHLPTSQVTGIDISPKAITLSRLNARINSLTTRFLQHDITTDSFIKDITHKHKWDIIISNPPYIPINEYEALDPSVKNFEDPRALIAGNDGLIFYERIITISHKLLTPKQELKAEIPRLVFEIGGKEQVKPIREMATKHGFERVDVWKDMAGVDRTLVIY